MKISTALPTKNYLHALLYKNGDVVIRPVKQKLPCFLSVIKFETGPDTAHAESEKLLLHASTSKIWASHVWFPNVLVNNEAISRKGPMTDA